MKTDGRDGIALALLLSLVCGLYGDKDGVYVVTIQSKHVEVTRQNLSNGGVIASHLLAAPWIDNHNVK